MDGASNRFKLPTITRKRVIAVIAVLVLITIGYNVTNRGYIEVDVSASGDSSITILSQASGETTTATAVNGKYKKMVGRGDYEVTVRNAAKSTFQVVKGKGFFGTTKVSGEFVAEKNRYFVGNSPADCFHYLQTVLMSYPCNGQFSGSVVHVPATASQPTYTNSVNGRFIVNGAITPGVKTSEGVVVLGNNSTKTALYTLGDNLAVSTVRDIPVETGKTYRMTPYADGFVVYNTSLEKAYVFASASGEPSEKSLKVTSTADFSPRDLAAQGDLFAGVFTAKGDGANGTEIIVTNTTTNTNYTWRFTGRVGDVRFCGDKRLCVIEDSNLRILDATKKSANEVFRVLDVKDLGVIGSTVLAVRTNDILAIDTITKAGSIDYSLAGYTYQSLQEDLNNYVVKLFDSKGGSVALRIDRSVDDTVSIDKKVSALASVSGVESISAYGNFIYLTSRSSVVFKQGFGFTYNETEKKATDDAINQKINEIGLDRTIYTVKNFANIVNETN